MFPNGKLNIGGAGKWHLFGFKKNPMKISISFISALWIVSESYDFILTKMHTTICTEFLVLFYSCSQIVIQKSSNDNFFVQIKEFEWKPHHFEQKSCHLKTFW